MVSANAPDQETRALLAQFRAADAAGLSALSVQAARAAAEALFTNLSAPAPPIAAVLEGALPGDDCSLNYRLYRADTNDSPHPILLFLHGGGWWLCSTRTHDRIARWLCHFGGIDVLSLEYRLAPEHPFPAALNDTQAAVRWIADTAARLRVDPTRIAIGGDSAGGALSAAAAAILRTSGTPRLAAMLLLYPSLTLADSADLPSRKTWGGGDYFLSEAATELAARYYLPDGSLRNDPRVSPLLEPDLSGMPPALVVTAGFDPLRDEGERYAQRLRSHGVHADYKCFESTIHGFMSFSAVLASGRDGLEFAGRWLRRRLRVDTQ